MRIPKLDLHKVAKVAASITAILVLVGIVAKFALAQTDNRYVLRKEVQHIIAINDLKEWKDQVELIKLKEAAGVQLTEDDKVKRAFYQGKIDKFILLNSELNETN